MPAIKPISVQDCVDFAKDNRDEIKEGIFDVHIQTSWIPGLPEEVFLFLVSYCPSTKKIVGECLTAGYPRFAELLSRLGQDEDKEVRECVARNPHAPQDLLVRLTTDYFKEVRLAVARNPALPAQTIEALSRENSTSIREAVLDNEHLTLKIINMLASDRSDRVQKKVALKAREAVQPRLIQMFARCAIPDVRVSVCANVHISLELLEILYRDENREVHQAAIARMEVMAASPKTPISCFAVLAALPQEGILMALAKNPHTPKPVLAGLAQQRNPMVKMVMLGNSGIDSDILQILASDTDDRVRVAVVSFPKTPAFILEKLAGDPSASVRNALGENPLEQQRRQQHNLCLSCGQPLPRIKLLSGTLCLKCSKQKVMETFSR
ncbi:MAG TPA: hypothetical protein HPQ00_09725 [Magnetococcales bacterium]|nr:hypothetical protein [Magnetococcales bacterium]